MSRPIAIDNHTLGRMPKASVQEFLSRMDALAILWHRSPLYRFGVSPNKVFDYMLSGKPILQAVGGPHDLPAEARRRGRAAAGARAARGCRAMTCCPLSG